MSSTFATDCKQRIACIQRLLVLKHILDSKAYIPFSTLCTFQLAYHLCFVLTSTIQHLCTMFGLTFPCPRWAACHCSYHHQPQGNHGTCHHMYHAMPRQNGVRHATWPQSCSRTARLTPVQLTCGLLGVSFMSVLQATRPSSVPPSTTWSTTSSLVTQQHCQVSYRSHAHHTVSIITHSDVTNHSVERS